MSAQPRYCTHCGAANAAESQLCFACQSPLNTSEENAQETLLHERYRLLTQVGAGGFGGVYRALDTAEGRRIVAIKQITLRGLSTQEAIEATDGFNREVRLLSDLRHPNLPMIRDTFTDPEHWYLVMDFIAGETLEEYLKQQTRPGLPLREALALGIQLCTVLDYLHTREPAIIFRDLKPSNVMRTVSGQIYLIDFGIARHFTPGKPKDTMAFGSPGYAAPEQYGRMQTTPQSDLYSLGALLHCLLTGNDPAESPFRFAPLPIADSTELAELDALIQRMVATEPDERPESAAEVKASLQHLLESLRHKERQAALANLPGPPRPQPAPIPVPTASGNWTRRGLLKGVATVGGIVVGIGGFFTVCTLVSRIPYGVHGVMAQVPPSPGVIKKQFVYNGHTGAITALSWSPDGLYIASGSADRTVQVWRALDGAWLYTLVGYDQPVTSVVWATDRKNVIASSGMSDGTVQVWDALVDHQDLTYHGDGRTLALSWQEHSPWIVSGGTDREIYTWNANNGQKGVKYTGHKGDVRALLWIPGTQSPITNSFTPVPTPPPGSITPPPNQFTPVPTPTSGSTTPPPNPFTPVPTPTGADLGTMRNGNLIASGGADHTVQIWDASTGEHLSTHAGHSGSINGLAPLRYAPGQPLEGIATASDDGTAHVWFPYSTYQTPTIYRGHHGKVNAVAGLPQIPYYGLRVASAGEDQMVQIWSFRSYNANEALTVYKEHQAPVRALASSPVTNDQRIVSGDADGLVHLWTLDYSYQ